jgi:hypothetical protein
MRQIIPFSKDIVFKTNIASINSISLEHEENVLNGELCGNFIIYGDYKVHSDTTETVDFNYKLPFTAILGEDVLFDSVVLDVENFNYEIIEDDVLRIVIEFSITAEVLEISSSAENDILEDIDRDIDEVLCLNENIEEVYDNSFENNDKKVEDIDDEIRDIIDYQIVDDVVSEKLPEKKEENIIEINNEKIYEDNMEEKVEIDVNTKEEYVTYHVHIVKENETIEQILKLYNVNLDYLKEYNNIGDLNYGDKIIIPEYGEE